MLTLRLGVLVVVLGCWLAVTSSANASKEDVLDYIDDIKHYSSHHAEKASAKYSEKLNKIDMIEDYPHDDEFHDHDDLEDDEEDEEDDEEDAEDDGDDEDDEDDEEGGGCGADDDDEEEEELNPVQEVIEEYFTR